MWGRAHETDTGWVGAGAEDDLDRRLAEEVDVLDPEQPFAMTVLGPIPPASLGVTLFGERVVAREPYGTTGAIGDRDAGLAELEDAYVAGARSVLALEAPGAGRDLAALRWLAGRAPVHLVAATGPPPARPAAAQTAAMIEELTVGMEGATSRAGVIVVAPSHVGDRAVLTATAAAQARTGTTICLFVADAGAALTGVAALANDGVEPGRTCVFGRAAAVLGDLRRLLGTGTTVAFHQLLSDGWERAAGQARTIVDLVGEGHGDRIVLASGLARRSALRGYGGEPGWGALVERFPLLLMEAGLDAPSVRTLLVDNPRRLLTIEARPHEGEGGRWRSRRRSRR